MKLKVIFKGGTIIKINDATSFAVNSDTENVLRVDTADGRAHFINFHEVLACLEVNDENRMKCRMCDADYFIRVKGITKTLLMPLTEEQAALDAVADKYGIQYKKIRPRFCPFCGRNLRDEEKTE